MTKEEILNKHDTSRHYIEQTCRPELFAAMDEYAKQDCIRLLHHLAMNMVVCGHYSSPDGQLFKYKDRLITKEQLYDIFIEQQTENK